MIWKRIKPPDPEKEEQFHQQMKDVKLGWKDKLAMVLSAYVVLLLPALLLVIGIAVFMLWAFGAL